MVVDDEIYQPKTLKMHCRFLTKVYEKVDKTSDYEPFSVESSAQDKTDEYNIDVRPENEMSNKKDTEVTRQEQKSKKAETKSSKPSVHKMSLRKRKAE